MTSKTSFRVAFTSVLEKLKENDDYEFKLGEWVNKIEIDYDSKRMNVLFIDSYDTEHGLLHLKRTDPARMAERMVMIVFTPDHNKRFEGVQIVSHVLNEGFDVDDETRTNVSHAVVLAFEELKVEEADNDV